MSNLIANWLESMTGTLPSFITYWPICIHKGVLDMHTHGNAKRLLHRCHIDARGNAWFWLFKRDCWIRVPRHQAARAEQTLKRYGYEVGGRNLS